MKKNKSKTHVKIIFSIKRNEKYSVFYGFDKKQHAQNIRKMNISTKKHAQTLNEFALKNQKQFKNTCKNNI